MNTKRLIAFLCFTAYCSQSFAQSLTDGNSLRTDAGSRGRYDLGGTDINSHGDVGEYRAGVFPGAILMPVHVWGASKTTGLFRVPKNTTLTTLLSYARGPADNARLDKISIKRVSEKTEKVIKVDMEKVIAEPENYDLTLMPSDIVYIDKKEALIHSDVLQTVALVSGIVGILLGSIVLSREASK